MKKITALLMALVMSLALVACGASAEEKMDTYITSLNEQIATVEVPGMEINVEEREGGLAIVYVLSDISSTTEGFDQIGAQLEANVGTVDPMFDAFKTEIKDQVSEDAFIILEYQSNDGVVAFSKEYK